MAEVGPSVHPEYDAQAGAWFVPGTRKEASSLAALSTRLPVGTRIEGYYPEGYRGKVEVGKRREPSITARRAYRRREKVAECVAEERGETPKVAAPERVAAVPLQRPPGRRERPAPEVFAALGEVWTPERDVRLMDLLGRGLSAALVAAEMRTSRNAVLGRSNRIRSLRRAREMRARLGLP